MSSSHSALNAAATNNVSLTGSTITASTTDVSGPPSSDTGTTSAPALIVQIVSNAQMNAFGGACPTSPTCTFITRADSSGHTMTAMTFVNNDTGIWNSSVFEPTIAHEMGHALLGLNDCSDCSSTEMNPLVTELSPSGPTICDSQKVFTDTGGAYGVDPNHFLPRRHLVASHPRVRTGMPPYVIALILGGEPAAEQTASTVQSCLVSTVVMIWSGRPMASCSTSRQTANH